MPVRLTIFRVFSGTLSGESFYNANKKTAERFGSLFLIEGKEQRQVDTAGPGDDRCGGQTQGDHYWRYLV